MGVRFSQPELLPTAAQVNRRFPEQSLIAERADTVPTGRDNCISLALVSAAPRRARSGGVDEGCARSSAAEHRFDVPEIAGSIPAARTHMSCSSNRLRNPVSQTGNT